MSIPIVPPQYRTSTRASSSPGSALLGWVMLGLRDRGGGEFAGLCKPERRKCEGSEAAAGASDWSGRQSGMRERCCLISQQRYRIKY